MLINVFLTVFASHSLTNTTFVVVEMTLLCYFTPKIFAVPLPTNYNNTQQGDLSTTKNI